MICVKSGITNWCTSKTFNIKEKFWGLTCVLAGSWVRVHSFLIGQESHCWQSSLIHPLSFLELLSFWICGLLLLIIFGNFSANILHASLPVFTQLVNGELPDFRTHSLLLYHWNMLWNLSHLYHHPNLQDTAVVLSFATTGQCLIAVGLKRILTQKHWRL